jgi:hypothetical protein
MRERAHHGMILLVRPWRGSKARESALRCLWVVAAALAILIAGVAGGEKSASATSYDSEELQFLWLINQYRENNGLETLLLSDTLSVASERHSQDMVEYGFCAHYYTVASSYYPAVPRPGTACGPRGTIKTPSWAKTSPSVANRPKDVSSTGVACLPTTPPCSTGDSG